tara:strand:- start:1746 stop:2111 length:366 start_codon:yes stop_codon:yes gene_type:complete
MEHINIEEKKKFIYSKINNLEFNSIYLKDYIINSNVKYTENSNGIFINLNTVSDFDIDNIYNIIINKINYNKLLSEKEYNVNNNNFNNLVTEDKKKKNYKDFNVNDFSEFDLELIKLSMNK